MALEIILNILDERIKTCIISFSLYLNCAVNIIFYPAGYAILEATLSAVNLKPTP